jgi:hypothetical protein
MLAKSVKPLPARTEPPSITPSERVLANFIASVYTGLLAHRYPFDENPSDEAYLDQSAYLGFELWQRWKRLVNEQRSIDHFEEHIK